jgi:ferric-dicitrate binding protein FerR (iron transport regulator)
MDDARLKELTFKYFMGMLSPSEEGLLQELLRDPDHQALFVKEARTFSVLHEWAAEQLQEQERIQSARRTTRRTFERSSARGIPPWLLTAAALLVAIGVVLIMLSSGSENAPGGRTSIASERSKSREETARNEAERRLAEIEQERRKIQKKESSSDRKPEAAVEEAKRQALAELDERKARIEEELRKAISSGPRENPPSTPPQTPQPEPSSGAKPPQDVRPPAPGSTQLAVAVVERVDGDVRVAGAAGNAPAKAGQQLLAGQGIETIGPGSAATIVFADKTRIDVSGSSVLGDFFETERPGKGKRVRVTRGSMTAHVAKQPAGQPMLLSSPQAEAFVLGTSLRLVVDPAEKGSTRLDVTEGKVELKRLVDGKTVLVESGHYAVATVGADLLAKSLPATLVFGGAAGKCEDSFIYGAPGFENYNYGAREALRSSDGPEGFALLLRFPNLVGSKAGLVPPRSTISSAMLRFKAQNPGVAAQVPAKIYRALKPWKEGRGDGTGSRSGEATWKAAQQGALAWEIPGAAGSTDRSPEIGGAPPTVDAAGFVAFDITPALQAWVNGEANYGLIVTCQSSWDFVVSSSKDKTPANRPQLSVTFSK